MSYHFYPKSQSIIEIHFNDKQQVLFSRCLIHWVHGEQIQFARCEGWIQEKHEEEEERIMGTNPSLSEAVAADLMKS